MEVLRNLILILSVLGVFAFGYFLVKRLDRFLDENRRAIERESAKKEPSCVMLTEDLSEEDIAEEVRQFRTKHEHSRVVMYDTSNTK